MAGQVPSPSSTREPPAPSKRSLSEIAALVSRLLSHYWTADDHPAVRQGQIEDWLDDLREFEPDVVKEACRQWRRSNTRRPTPADIRTLCMEERSVREWRERRKYALPAPVKADPEFVPPTDEERREMAEMAERAIASLRLKAMG